ncbi:MAG: hypothetical protein IKH04_04365 [Kiritimatiellae bacterium]|nr:hypothetical protein [Kiritimatiellia bacterium]
MKQVLVIILLAVIAWLLYDRNRALRGEGAPFPRAARNAGGVDAGAEPPWSRPSEREPSIRRAPTDEEMRLAETWPQTKPAYAAEAARIKGELERKSVSPWHCDTRLSAALERSLGEFDRVLADDDFLNAPDSLERVRRNFARFEGGCRWQPGVRGGDGYVSSATPGEWVLEAGYEIINGRPAKVAPCHTCQGRGWREKRQRCGNCQGRGRVENPAFVAAKLAHGHVHGKFAKNLMKSIPKSIKCEECRGTGTATVRVQCPACAGRGRTFK